MGTARSAVRRWNVVLSTRFLRDTAAQIDWLRNADRTSTIEALRADLRIASRLLAKTPFFAPADQRDVRRLLLGKVAFFLWYRVEERSRRVRWLRLFHVRQRAPRG